MKLLNQLAAMTLAAGIASMGLTAMAAEDIKVYVNGKQIEFDVDPIIENERTLVPMRAIFEALGAEVEWEQETAAVTASRGDDVLKISIGSNTLYKNDSTVELDVPAKIVDERTLVPIRAISESFDAVVDWDGDTHSIFITTEPGEAAAGYQTMPYDTLTDKDMAALIEIKDELRYSFEQRVLPNYALGSETIYADMAQDTKDGLTAFSDKLYKQWTETAALGIFAVQRNSDTVYDLDMDLNSDDAMSAILAGYEKILAEAGMDADAMFSGVAPYVTDAGTRIAVMVFRSADSLVQCKYLGIAASKDGKTRCFTAENDIMQPDIWFVCEVTEEGRGTLLYIQKTDESADLLNFATACAMTYEGSKTAKVKQPDINVY